MSVVLQIRYAPGAGSPEKTLDVAQQIAAVPGLHWKLWVGNAAEGTSGGIYLFATEASARAFESQARPMLAAFGATDVAIELLSVNEALSAATRAPLPAFA